jgi:hypothetical protein
VAQADAVIVVAIETMMESSTGGIGITGPKM